jgi:hypothetical protein
MQVGNKVGNKQATSIGKEDNMKKQTGEKGSKINRKQIKEEIARNEKAFEKFEEDRPEGISPLQRTVIKTICEMHEMSLGELYYKALPEPRDIVPTLDNLHYQEAHRLIRYGNSLDADADRLNNRDELQWNFDQKRHDYYEKTIAMLEAKVEMLCAHINCENHRKGDWK